MKQTNIVSRSQRVTRPEKEVVPLINEDCHSHLNHSLDSIILFEHLSY
jgi:hypothetical protein